MHHATSKFRFVAVIGALLSASALAAPISSGYTQDFNVLGPTGTSLANAGIGEWSVYRIPDPAGSPGGAANRWTAASGVIASDLSNGVFVNDTNTVQSSQAPLGIFYNPSFPTFTRFGGVNAGRSMSTTETNRSLGTSPTGTAGHALQLSLDNDTGSTVTSLSLVFETIGLAPGLEELAGYRFFYSLTGASGTWLSDTGFDVVTVAAAPAFTSYSTSGTLNLANGLAANSTLLLRWVDDNGFVGSPDQMLSIDNVSVNAVVAAVPEPGTWALVGIALATAMAARSRRRT